MKGPSLQRQFEKCKEGTRIIVDENPYYGSCDCVYYTERHGDWELIRRTKTCDLNCKECGEYGLWDKKGRYYIPRSDIWRLRLD